MRQKTICTTDIYAQWISEVLHFCPHLPIILVGCKSDLRHDMKTIEELHKTSQKPVTPEQVSLPPACGRDGCALLTVKSGRGCPQEDWCLQVPRVLCKDQRGRARGV